MKEFHRKVPCHSVKVINVNTSTFKKNIIIIIIISVAFSLYLMRQLIEIDRKGVARREKRCRFESNPDSCLVLLSLSPQGPRSTSELTVFQV